MGLIKIVGIFDYILLVLYVQELDKAMEVEAFRVFSEKVLF